MNASEFFNDSVVHYFGSSSSYGDWTRHYWELEFVVACMNDCHFSDIDELQDERERTCEMCGHVHATDKWGRVEFCTNEICKEIRSFFGFTSGKCPFLANGKVGSVRHKRASWLRKSLADNYGSGTRYTIYQLPIDCRLPVLISMQIVREQIEYNRTSGDAGEANDFDASEPKQREQTESYFADGNGSSVYQLN